MHRGYGRKDGRTMKGRDKEKQEKWGFTVTKMRWGQRERERDNGGS